MPGALVAQLLFIPAVFALGMAAGWDMARRGQSPTRYMVLLFLILPLGLVMWLSDRRRFPRLT